MRSRAASRTPIPKTRRIRTDRKPVAGTRLLREFQGVEHIVTVTIEGYEYRGRPYKSLSAIAKATSCWREVERLGLLRPEERGERHMRRAATGHHPTTENHAEGAVRDLYAQIVRGRARHEFNNLDAQRRRATSLSQGPEGGLRSPFAMTTAGFRAARWSGDRR